MKKMILSALIEGSALYLLTVFSACLSVLNLTDELFAALLTAVLVTGAVIVIALFIYHRVSFKQQFLSILIWQTAFCTLFLADSFSGITRSLITFPEDNLAGGLIMVMFWLSYSGLSVIGLVFTGILKLIQKFRKTK